MSCTMRNEQKSQIARLEALVDRVCDTYVTNGPLPHLQLLLSVDGEIILDHCQGQARAGGPPLQEDALYRLASMSKPLVIAAALVLVEEGRLAFDMPVAVPMPEFSRQRLWTGEVDEEGKLITIPCDGTMTILDLMRHTAGLTYSIHGATALDRFYAEHYLDSFHQRRNSDDYAAVLAEAPLLYRPGERFHYSASVDLLGIVIERVSGMSLDHFLDQAIFAPLGMVDSFFMVPPDRIDRLTDAWMVERPGAAPTLYDRGGHSRWRMPQKSWSGGGGLVSSARDYHRFLSMLMEGGVFEGRRILSQESVTRMMTNQLPSGGDLVAEGASPVSETAPEGVGMGLGGAVLLDPARVEIPGSKGTWFWGGLLSTGFFLDPVRRVIGIAMTQLMPPDTTRLREDFRRGVEEIMREDGNG